MSTTWRVPDAMRSVRSFVRSCLIGSSVCCVLSTHAHGLDLPEVPRGVVAPDGLACATSVSLPQGLTVPDAVSRILCRDPDTREAWAHVAARSAQLGVAWSAYLPSLSGQTGVSRVARDTRVEGLPGVTLRERVTSRDGSLNLNWTLFDFGQREAGVSLASRQLAAAVASHDLAVQSAYRMAAQTVYDVMAARARAQAAVEQRQLAFESHAAAKARFAAGVAPLADQVQAETAHAQATLRHLQAEGLFAGKSGDLMILMGLSPESTLDLAPDEDPRPPPDFMISVAGLLDEAQRRYPGLVAARASLAAAERNIDKVRAEGRPVISLTGSLGRNNLHDRFRPDSIADEKVIGVQVRIPLFEGFSRVYKVREAQAQVKGERARLARTEQDVARQVWASAQALRIDTESLAHAEALRNLAQRSVEIAQGRYRAGVGTLIELLDAQRTLAEAREQQILTQMNWRTDRLDLALSLGRLGS